jgi:hypothetical protein
MILFGAQPAVCRNAGELASSTVPITRRYKENARLIISQIVLDAIDDLKLANPKTTVKRRRELKAIRKGL